MNVSMLEALELCDISSPSRMPGHIVCPFHAEDTASCAVWEDHWHCFGCARGGSPLSFIAYWVAEGADPDRAAFSLAAKLVNRTFDMEDRPERVVKERELQDFAERFVTEALQQTERDRDEAKEFIARKWPHLTYEWLAKQFGVLATRGALWIPHFGDGATVRGVKTRSYATGNKLSIEGSCYTTRLYRRNGLDVATQPPVAVLCEGESDTWTMTKHYEGMPVAVYGLPSGALCWKPQFADELVAKHRHVDLWLDPDQTGRKAAALILEDLMRRGLSVEDRVVPIDYGDVTEAVVDGWRP